MIIGRNNTVAWFETLNELNFPYWTIYWRGKTDSGHFVFKSSQAEGLTMTESMQDLRKKLDMIGYGQYTINAQSKPGSIGKGSAKMDFEIATTEQQPATIGSVQQPYQSMVGYVTEDKANELADKRFEQLMMKRENEDLKKLNAELLKEKKELENEAESGTTRIVNMIAGFVQPMLATPAAAQVGTLGMPVKQLSPAPGEAVSGTGDIPDTAPTAEQVELGTRLQIVLTECEAIFSEPAIPFLEKLMTLVKEKPFYVPIIKQMLYDKPGS